MANFRAKSGPAPDGRALRRRPQLSDEVAGHLRESIMSGQVRQGEYLRLEHIAEELGTSATPVREALLALRGEGFVQLEPRRGFVVAPLSRRDVQDVFFVHATIAAELAARAASRVTDDDVSQLVQIHSALTEAAHTGTAMDVEEINSRFHRTVATLANSDKLAWFLETAVRYVPRRFYGSIAGWQQAAITDGLVLVAALRARHPERARHAMHQHITRIGELLEAHLERQGLWPSMEQPTTTSASAVPGAVDGATTSAATRPPS